MSYMQRYKEPGWERVTPPDKAGRRALWMREVPGGGLELCAGREGDDAYVKISSDHPEYKNLIDLLYTLQYGYSLDLES